MGVILATPVVTRHNILSAFHSDAVVDAVTRGSLIYGNATPAWDELVIGALSTHLESDGTDVAWQANLTMADDAWIGLGGAAGRLVFDVTPAPDQVEVTDADLNFVTAAHGIIHVDGVAAGMVLRADGTRYVPASAVATVPLPPVAQNDMLIADAVPEWSILTGPAAQGQVLVAGAAPLIPAWGTVLTANISFDDGVGDSPLLSFVGQSDESVSLYFDDTARSLVITLEDNKADAMRIVDAGGLEYLRFVTTNAGPLASFDPAGAGGVKVGIGTPTVPHGGVGYASLALEGPNINALGPHIQLTTATDDYPLLQIAAWQHDDIQLRFDNYYDGAEKSSDVGSNFRIAKVSDTLRLQGQDGVAAGGALGTWNGLTIDVDGHVGIGTTNPGRWFHVDSGTLDVGIRLESSDAFAKFEVGDSSVVMGEVWFGAGSGGAAISGDGGNISVYVSAARLVGINEVTPGALLHADLTGIGGGTICAILQGAAGQAVALLQLQETDGSVFLDSGDGLGGSMFSGNQQLEDIDFVWAGDTEANLFRIDAGADAVHMGDWDTNYVSFALNGDQAFTGTAGFYPRRITQSAEPVTGTGATQIDTGELIIWRDPDDNRTYLVYNDTDEGVRLSEMI